MLEEETGGPEIQDHFILYEKLDASQVYMRLCQKKFKGKYHQNFKFRGSFPGSLNPNKVPSVADFSQRVKCTVLKGKMSECLSDMNHVMSLNFW